MKRIVTLLLAAGLVFGATTASQAADVKVKGMWDFTFEFADTSFSKHNNNTDTFSAVQRLRTQVDFIASESLKGVVFFEIGNTNWGRNSQGGALGTDGINVEVRYSYVDWVVPNTDLKVRMGLQPFNLPNFIEEGSNVLGNPTDAAALALAYDFNENVGATLFWLRAENNNAGTSKNYSDALDFVGLTVPVKLDGFKVTPWAMYGFVGSDSFEQGSGNSNVNTVRNGMLPNGVDPQSAHDRSGNAWWGGLTAEMTYFNPFRAAFDFNYGSVDLGNGDRVMNNLTGRTTTMELKRAGWYAAILGEYKFDMATPGLVFWYASGDNSNPYDGSERLPTISGGFSPTSYGYDGNFSLSAADMIGTSSVGNWAVMLQVKDITFMEDLKHVFRVLYTRGTNNKNIVKNSAAAGISLHPYENIISYDGSSNGSNGLYLTTKDSAWEVNFDSTYNIYKDLSLVLELGYINLDLDKGVWGKGIVDNTQENNFRGALNLRYAF